MAIYLFHSDISYSMSITIDNYLLSIVMDTHREIGDSGAPNRRRPPQPGVRTTTSARVSQTWSAP